MVKRMTITVEDITFYFLLDTSHFVSKTQKFAFLLNSMTYITRRWPLFQGRIVAAKMANYRLRSFPEIGNGLRERSGDSCETNTGQFAFFSLPLPPFSSAITFGALVVV